MRQIHRTLELGCEIPREKEGGMVQEEQLERSGYSPSWPYYHWQVCQGSISTRRAGEKINEQSRTRKMQMDAVSCVSANDKYGK